jgi:hypothetical protein
VIFHWGCSGCSGPEHSILHDPDMNPAMNPGNIESHLSESGSSSRRKPRDDAATGASAAGVRAVSAQMVAFYFRAPIKAFFRTRVEYVALNLPPRTMPPLLIHCIVVTWYILQLIRNPYTSRRLIIPAFCRISNRHSQEP